MTVSVIPMFLKGSLIRAFLRVALLAAVLPFTAGLICGEQGESVWINETGHTLAVYEGDGHEDLIVTLRPHSDEEVRIHEQLWVDTIIVRDSQGNELMRQTLTWEDFEAQDFRIVITEDMLSVDP